MVLSSLISTRSHRKFPFTLAEVARGSLLALAASALACSGTESPAPAGSGGAVSVGGSGNGGAPVGSGGTTSLGPTGGTNNGNPTGGNNAAPTGGRAPTGGNPATGGSNVGVGGAATGGKATGGAATGGTTSTGATTGPCDIYAAASPATPCVAAYSTTRLLRAAYTGPLYQVRKGGTVQDIMAVGGFADGASQDTFCGTSACTVSILYDQSTKGNNLKVAPAGCYTGTASEADYESNAKGKTVQISGHKVYALYMIAHDGYRNNTPSGMPTGSAAQGIYEIADGARTPLGSACCWDFGNASTNNCNQGTMNAMYFGTGYWGKGAGSGPWFLADLEGGVWAGGTGASTVVNPNLPSSKIPFAFGILKTSTSNYVIRVGDATSGTLTTGNNSGLPKTLNSPGGIILGIGGDNSNSSLGTFFEGAITAGQPSDATDALVLANVQAAKYGQ